MSNRFPKVNSFARLKISQIPLPDCQNDFITGTMSVKGAKNAGILKLIWKDINNKKQENLEELNGVDVINQFEELKNIL